MKVTIMVEKYDRMERKVIYEDITTSELTQMSYSAITDELYAGLFEVSRKMVNKELNEISERLDALDAEMQAFLAEMRESLMD